METVKNHRRKILTIFSMTNIKNHSFYISWDLVLIKFSTCRHIPPFLVQEAIPSVHLMSKIFKVKYAFNALPYNIEYK